MRRARGGFRLEFQCPKVSKNDAKSLENRGRGPQNRGPEGSRRGLGRVLGRLERLDRFFGFRGGSWVRLVGQKTPTWPQLGPQDGAQIAPKSMPKLMPKIDASWTSIFGVFFRILGRKRRPPKWSPKSILQGKRETQK